MRAEFYMDIIDKILFLRFVDENIDLLVKTKCELCNLCKDLTLYGKTHSALGFIFEKKCKIEKADFINKKLPFRPINNEYLNRHFKKSVIDFYKDVISLL